MIKAIQDKINQLKKVQKNLSNSVLGAVKDYEAEILDLNTDDQLFQKGIDSEGRRIEPGYRPLTIQIKRSKGQPTNRVTLKDTGSFHNSFAIEFQNDGFAIVTDDNKTKKIERKYGNKIAGLTDENLQEVIEMLKPDLIENIQKQIL